MAAIATATATEAPGPRYAPDDPSLPKPWRGLVDGNTGYLYFWNPETNVTQYERPVPVSVASSSPRPSMGYVSSSVQVEQSPRFPRRSEDNDEKYSRRGADELGVQVVIIESMN